MADKLNFFQRVYKKAEKIPYGKVATYGQLAALAGSPRAARQVGWALHQLMTQTGKDRKRTDTESIPWHRVVNREGRISTTCLEHPAEEQAELLKKEGVSVKYRDGNYWIDLSKYQWKFEARNAKFETISKIK